MKPIRTILSVFTVAGLFVSNVFNLQSAAVTLDVPANPLWTDTGISLTNGDTVAIIASGVWSYQGGETSGPEGAKLTLLWENTDFFSADGLHGELIAYVGIDPYQGHWGDRSGFWPQTNAYWNIGTNCQFTVSSSGELWLGCNDDAVSKSVEDNSGSVNAQIGVFSAPAFQMIMQTNGGINLSWSVLPGNVYQLQYTTDLMSTNWINLGAALTATNSTTSTFDLIGPDPQRFYRVMMMP